MHSSAAIVLALQCTLGLCIRVPIVWNEDNSEVNSNQFATDTVPPQNEVKNNQKHIPKEYFQYTAQKPKFAVDIAKFHGVQSPENLYKAHPVKPHTGVSKPELGKHQMLEEEKKIFHPFQTYVNKNEPQRYATPVTSNYEIFHPYKLEEPALKELYKDPVMDKIRNDLLNSKNRLQKYENEAGEPDINKNEYLESPEETDRKKFPQRNIPATYEIHRPQRRPVYYRPPMIPHHREHVLNQKFRHPWHQNYVKVKPLHYRPVKNHLQRLRQQHALKYDDEHNEYPQLPPPEKYSEPSDGYDIYEKGKAKFVQLRNNVDESINEAIQQNRPIINQKLELNDEDSSEDSDTSDDEDEFIPIKNYAQVRRTETTKHLPKAAAFHDADTLDEIRNAPRLREAIKSTKAQTVYSEEGYEDSAYDHAGEQKHASENEGHGGFLKEKELSGGKYKTPTFSAKYKDEDSSEYRDQVLDGKKWKDNKKDTEEETESEDYSEVEKEQSAEDDIYNHVPKKNKSDKISEPDESNTSLQDKDIERLKREDASVETHIDTPPDINQNSSEHDVNKREAKIEIPQINLNTTYLTPKEILKLPLPLKLKVPPKVESVREKYPYYFTKLKSVSKDSPLRYAENLKLIPKKSEGGTEFYESRSEFECPEVDDDVDPIPEKLKKGGNPDEDDEDDDDNVDGNKKDKADFSGLEGKPRLNGLGDKIDCFKAKYFGENPLDSPFFQEEIISNPEPITVPSLDVYKLKQAKEKSTVQQKTNNILAIPELLQEKANYGSFIIPDQSSQKQISHVSKGKGEKQKSSGLGSNEVKRNPQLNISIIKFQDNSQIPQNNTNLMTEQKQNVTQIAGSFRKRRSTPFIYEPYKIIKDSQIQDSKKTTTTSNISPLIKQLQSSRVVDRVASSQGKDQVVKRNASPRTYKDIGKNDREKSIGKEKGSQPTYDASFVDVSVDQRRGEPKYELRPNNHKSQYTPVENRKSMTVEDYNVQTNADTNSDDYGFIHKKQIGTDQQVKSTRRPYFDVSKFLPHAQESNQNESSSNKKEMKPHSRSDESTENTENEDEYDEYDDEDINEQKTTTTTTIRIPQRRRKITTTSTTEKSHMVDVDRDNVPKLRLITRFRDSYQTEKPETVSYSEKPSHKVHNDDESITAPKYREKKKKTSKSTLVTDTKSYGEDDNDDLRKEEVDALIGVKQDAKEYMPEYEKVPQSKGYLSKSQSNNEDNEEDDDNDEVDHDEDEDRILNDDDVDEDDDDDDDDDDEGDEDEEDEVEHETKTTTPEPTKRTLPKTTERPLATTEARSAKLEVKPVVLKKKIEIHKELPVNRSSPHITEFKQDIKEVEIIKEIPSKTKKKPQKNIEALELYKDENLAKEVNKLGAVEIFKDGLDLVNGPKHGGNYRSAEGLADEPSLSITRKENKNSPKDDVVASQSKTSKHIEVKDDLYGSQKKADTQRIRGNRGRSAKIIELSDSTERATLRPMHGGNFKSIHDERRRGGGRNAKLIELDDSDSREDHSTNTHGSDFKSYGSRSGNRNHMHGGNYRSARIIQAHNTEDTESNKKENLNRRNTNNDGRRNAAKFLSSIASAVPVMTTTPVYILDPSKRMYYYVDA